MAFPSVVLPELISIKYGRRYLQFQTGFDKTNGILKFQDIKPKLEESSAVFEVENSNTWDGLVHIKSRYNNKYLVRCSPIWGYISATANASDDDKASWTCTLFKPELLKSSSAEGTMTIKLCHVNTEYLGKSDGFVRVVREDDEAYNECLSTKAPVVDGKGNKLVDEFVVINRTWSPIPKWLKPKLVAFKIPNKNTYLYVNRVQGKNYLSLASIPWNQFVPIFFHKAVHQIYPTAEGVVYIESSTRNDYTKEFWMSSGGWINAEVDHLPSHAGDNDAAMFRVVMPDPNQNLISLLSLNSMNVCEMTFHKKSGSYFLSDNPSTDESHIPNISEFEVVPIVDLLNQIENKASIPTELAQMFQKDHNGPAPFGHHQDSPSKAEVKKFYELVINHPKTNPAELIPVTKA